MVDRLLFPQHGGVVLVMLRDGSQIEGALIVRTNCYSVAGVVFQGCLGALVREVMDDEARDRLVGKVVGHLLDGVSEPVPQRAFEYWRNVDDDLGHRVEKELGTRQS